jgi:hypothetical protein
MRLIVEGEISATSYKKLVQRLRKLNRTQLWEILDHFIFHTMDDKEVDDLLKILDEKALEPKPNRAVASALDDDLFYAIDPRDRFRSPIIATIPDTDDLEKYKDQLDILYDRNCFETYIEPEIQSDVAHKLIAFATDNELPVLDHWVEFSIGDGEDTP